jgi:SAM-dependent methyltransferase
MVVQAAGERARGRVLDNGCGVGLYLGRLRGSAQVAVGVELDFDRARQAASLAPVTLGAGEHLPLPSGRFDLVLSHEVIEHVQDDRRAVQEIVRVLGPGGRLVLFVPNRGYPFETHGIFWRGRYRFGNIPLVNYLPRRWRDRLAPHVRAYLASDLARIFAGLPVRVVQRTVIFGAYDNLIARWGTAGRLLRTVLQALEATPLRAFGLSHLWVVEKV